MRRLSLLRARLVMQTVRVRIEDAEAIAAALGQAVTGTRTLAGGFSHETCLLELADSRRVVARLGGGDPAVEAAVMDAAREHVPVPEVLCVLPGVSGMPGASWVSGVGGGGSRPAMVLEYVDGTPLSEVLASGAGRDPASMAGLGAAVGRAFGRIGAVTFARPGFFTGPDLAVGDMPPWSEQLPGLAAKWTGAAPGARLDREDRRAWTDLCAAHAPALASVDGQAQLVHADANPKNVLVTRAAGGWRVDAILDWEFSFSGCPYADYANMTRLSHAYPEAFTDGFRAGFASGSARDLHQNWAYLGHVFDMFALSDLLTRPEGHPVADQAAAVIRHWIAHGIPG